MGKDTRLLHPAWSSRDCASAASLGNMFWCLTTLTAKNFLPTTNLNPSFCNLKPFPLVLSLHALVISRPPFLQTPFIYFIFCKAALRFSHQVIDCSFFESTRPPNSLSTDFSICQIHVSSIQRQGCHAGQCLFCWYPVFFCLTLPEELSHHVSMLPIKLYPYNTIVSISSYFSPCYIHL